MNTLSPDSGLLDPYSKAVEAFSLLLRERFPTHERLGQELDFLDLLMGEEDRLLHRQRETVDSLLLLLRDLGLEASVPERDIQLLILRYEDCVRYSSRLTGPAGGVQLALEEAYADSTRDEKALVANLVNLRDTIFEGRNHGRSWEDFLLNLSKLRNGRQSSGYPSWRKLEDHERLLRSHLREEALR